MHALRRFLIIAATIAVVAVLVLDVLSVVGWPREGPIALAQVLAAHLTLLLVVVVPIAFLHEARILRVALLLLVVVSLGRFAGEWWSWPSGVPEDAAALEVMTWNLEFDSRTPAEAVAFLRASTARVVALQELTPAVSAAIAADPVLAQRFPHQALYPRPADALGMGLLSADALSDVQSSLGPPRLLATVETPVGPTRVVNVHPLHGEIERGAFGLPTTYVTAWRDATLEQLRDLIADDPWPGPVLVIGDINTASTEPAFSTLMAGYRDAHAEVGLGPGWTYRPDVLEPLGIGLIRIDVVLTGAGLRPVAETTVCPASGDHCAVLATVVADAGD